MSISTMLSVPLNGSTLDTHLPSRTTGPTSDNNTRNYSLEEYELSLSNKGSSSATPTSTPMTSLSTNVSDIDGTSQDVKRYVALGCLHFNKSLPIDFRHGSNAYWHELLHPDLPDEVKSIIGDEATRLLQARWIRMFHHCPNIDQELLHSIIRVYLLPEDWGRRFVNRTSQSLKAALRLLLSKIDVSPVAWFGDYSEAEVKPFDPWATAENLSLFYLFNKLPSPAPAPEKVKNRFSRRAMEDVLDSAASPFLGKPDGLLLEGLKTRLYPYQARSAALMLQRESAPQLQLDPRLEIRQSPNGERFFFGARDGSFLQEPRFYETTRGGILAETMGLGKTVMCLSVILATRGHLPQIPAAYQPAPRIRDNVGSLKDMAASIIGRYAVPAKVELERYEAIEGIDLSNHKDALEQNIPYYEVPPELPRMNRNTKIPPPRQLVMCSGTIIVVPRNLLHQWQAEIRKHVVMGNLKILVVDTAPKRGSKNKGLNAGEDSMEFRSDLPAPTDLMEYDIILFTRNRFEQEIQDGADEQGRRDFSGAQMGCHCPYIGATRIPDCSCKGKIYESPLKKVHWFRIIIDEGHNFSSSMSNAVLVAKQLQAERRWVVSGTPAKNLVGVEVDLATLDEEAADPSLLRELAIEQRKNFILDDENTKAAKALGSLAANFLMTRPWSDSSTEGRLPWDDYIYRHEHQYLKTYSGFSSCFLRTLEGLVVKTRPDDVEKDIVLPPMRHRVVYIKPCWFDKMTANLFVQVLRANAITSERSDVDYLFHKNSVKARHSLIKNLRQSNFTWTGFSLDDVISTLETSAKYLGKDDKQCSPSDAELLSESSNIISTLATFEPWIALSKAHEVGMAVEKWPQDSEENFSLAYLENPTMIGITQLLDGQLHVDSHILSEAPSEGLEAVGQASKARIAAMEEAENKTKENREKAAGDAQLKRIGVPTSAVGGQPLTSRRTSTITSKISPHKSKVSSQKPDKKSGSVQTSDEVVGLAGTDLPVSPVKPRKRKLTLSDEMAELPSTSPLRDTRVVGTTSAKLSYLIGKIMKHQATEKIIVFYDGDNAAFYIAQCLEMLYVNHRIYARTLDNTKRSEYVALFNEDPDIRVLLIDVACGALGLNLNAASVVLIVNPINRAWTEAQAIKRAHRIGQTKEVLVETLVLEGTIEEAIFKQAKKMSRQQHLEAKELEDDAGIIDIIQNAQVLSVGPEESQGFAKFAPLQFPQQVFGRPDRHKYHRFGHIETKEKPKKKKAKTTSGQKDGKGRAGKDETKKNTSSRPSDAVASRDASIVPGQEQAATSSIFGMGNGTGSSLFGQPL